MPDLRWQNCQLHEPIDAEIWKGFKLFPVQADLLGLIPGYSDNGLQNQPMHFYSRTKKHKAWNTSLCYYHIQQCYNNLVLLDTHITSDCTRLSSL